MIQIYHNFRSIDWWAIGLVTLIASVGFAMLYSAADGHFHPWASKQILRFILSLGAMLVVAVIDIRTWMRYAYIIYFVSLGLLVLVEVCGWVGMGAQRWIDLYVFKVQPSEMMKVAIVLVLARYLHGLRCKDIQQPRYLLFPILLTLLPVILVLRQPDLGTAIIILLVAGMILFVCGLSLWYFAGVLTACLISIPIIWQFLHDYQKSRVLIFLNPDHDPLKAGYQIIQSKIAFGSGGLFGKGFLGGSQSHLNFLPAKQTDFIFAMFCEEFGLVGGVALIFLYVLLIGYGITTSFYSTHQFGRYVSIGISYILFLYVAINVAMVMGLLPVVGVPLPLVTFGGTSMLTLMIGFGFILSVANLRHQRYQMT